MVAYAVEAATLCTRGYSHRLEAAATHWRPLFPSVWREGSPRVRDCRRHRCGLPAGPFGLIGAAEGISYLVVIGFVASSLLSKATSGSGLPAGPGGLLGAHSSLQEAPE